MKFLSKVRACLAAKIIALLLIGCLSTARADIYIQAVESGGMTTFSLSGDFDVTGLTQYSSSNVSAYVNPVIGFVGFKHPDAFSINSIYQFAPHPGVTSFGAGGLNSAALNTSGDTFEVRLDLFSTPGIGLDPGFVSGDLTGEMSYNATIAGLGLDVTPFTITMPNGQKIFMFQAMPVAVTQTAVIDLTDYDAIRQLISSGLTFNQHLSGIGLGAHQSGVRGFSSRLFRSRNRYESPGGTTASTLDTSAGREVSVSRYMRMVGRLSGDVSVSLSGTGSDSADSFEGVAANSRESSPFGSVEMPAGATVPPGALAAGDDWMVYTAVDFGEYRLNDLGSTPGMKSHTQSAAVGFEYLVSDQLSVGAGWSHLWNDNTLRSGLGSVDVEGHTAVVYASWFENNFWADFLYSHGTYDADLLRNTGLGTAVTGRPDIESDQVDVNLGYNLGIDGGRVIHGPTLGAVYTDGRVDAYTETGDPRSNGSYAAQSYESFITRFGYQVNWGLESTVGEIRPQLRLAYGRENLKRDNAVAATLIPNALNNNTVFGIGSSSADPGEGWLELGAGFAIALSENCSILVDYETQLFRQDVDLHYGLIQAQMRF